MLSDMQAMVVDYKKKSHYSNLVAITNQDETTEEQKTYEETMALPPPSRLTYRTGDSFNVSVTSQSRMSPANISRS